MKFKRMTEDNTPVIQFFVKKPLEFILLELTITKEKAIFSSVNDKEVISEIIPGTDNHT